MISQIPIFKAVHLLARVVLYLHRDGILRNRIIVAVTGFDIRTYKRSLFVGKMKCAL